MYILGSNTIDVCTNARIARSISESKRVDDKGKEKGGTEIQWLAKWRRLGNRIVVTSVPVANFSLHLSFSIALCLFTEPGGHVARYLLDLRAPRFCLQRARFPFRLHPFPFLHAHTDTSPRTCGHLNDYTDSRIRSRWYPCVCMYIAQYTCT